MNSDCLISVLLHKSQGTPNFNGSFVNHTLMSWVFTQSTFFIGIPLENSAICLDNAALNLYLNKYKIPLEPRFKRKIFVCENMTVTSPTNITWLNQTCNWSTFAIPRDSWLIWTRWTWFWYYFASKMCSFNLKSKVNDLALDPLVWHPSVSYSAGTRRR